MNDWSGFLLTRGCSVCSVCGVYVCPYCREVDEDLRVVHSGADGFVEQVEGWAFLMAVLPRINDCDAAVATTVIENVQIRNSDSDPRAFNRFGEGCGVNAKGASSEADPAAHSYAPAHCTMTASSNDNASATLHAGARVRGALLLDSVLPVLSIRYGQGWFPDGHCCGRRHFRMPQGGLQRSEHHVWLCRSCGCWDSIC